MGHPAVESTKTGMKPSILWRGVTLNGAIILIWELQRLPFHLQLRGLKV
jgi:hypothetical protein